MKLKTFHGRTMAETLAKVKREFGKDAVILNTRSTPKQGVLGLRGKPYVEITAARQMSDLPAPLKQGMLPVRSGRTNESDGAAEIVTSHKIIPVTTPATTHDRSLFSEISDLKKMVSDLVRTSNRSRHSSLPHDLVETYQQLIENEVADELASEMVQQVHLQLTDSQQRDSRKVREVLSSLVGSMLPPAAPIQLLTTRTPTIIAFVGPTGVGKTTTIAKLAANFCLREHRKVGLITLDTYRIAAVDQLKTYAQIIDIPIEVAMTVNQFSDAISRMADREVILVDTAGRSQRERSKMLELQTYFNAVKPHEIHLVLSSTCGEKVLCDTMDRFSPLGFDHVIFTKLDEAIGFGVILTCLQKTKVKLSYITTGQDVPDDIEVGHKERLTQLILSDQKNEVGENFSQLDVGSMSSLAIAKG